MKTLPTYLGLATLVIGATVNASANDATLTFSSSIAGRWDAALVNNGPDIPFRLDISGAGPTLKGTFYDGFKPYDATTRASFKNGQLILKAEHYLTTITARLKDGELSGDTVLEGPGYVAHFDFHAVRHVDAPAVAETVPVISGSWEIPLESPSKKGEQAYRFIVEQRGANAAASILRVDGDTGAYSGTYKDGQWVLSHFDGSRPGVIVVKAKGDGTLEIVAHNEAILRALEGNDSKKQSSGGGGYADKPAEDAYAPTLIAYRSEVARAKGLPEPANYTAHTTVRDSEEKFTFNFRDVDGRWVSNDDPRFKGKVVLAIVTGTWCPNCHDEAQYLVELDRKYRDRGLAIVALDFEEPEQQANLVRERAFVKQYGVKYTYLIAGAPAEMWEKIPQAVNLNTWPATLFVGRDGLVKSIHAGFASPASGEFNRQLKQEFTSKIEQLLAENSTITTADNNLSSFNRDLQAAVDIAVH
jgi:thiol-disulfide isomerase/thioredoxin